MKSFVAGILAFTAMILLWFYAPQILVAMFDFNMAVVKKAAGILPGHAGPMCEAAARMLGADRILLFFEGSMFFRLLLALL